MIVIFLRGASLEEVVVAWLRAERRSPFSRQYLAFGGLDEWIIDHPDVNNSDENAVRWQALGHRRSIFRGISPNTKWSKATLSAEDLDGLLAGDYDTWRIRNCLALSPRVSLATVFI